MIVLLFGATGMVGEGVLRECLLDPVVEHVLAVGRTPTGRPHEKLEELTCPDLTQLGPVEGRLAGYDACFFCLGISSIGLSEPEFSRVTYDLTLSIAERLARLNPGMTFVYVSGAGTDSSERGRTMWARVKGRTENALLRLPFRAAYMFRPGVIQPVHGVRSKTRTYRAAYIVLWPIVALLLVVAPNSVTTTERVGKAMIRAARDGAPTRWVSTRDINALARSP